MEKEQQRLAKRQVAVLMHQGTFWKEATATAGVHISRSAAYRWLNAWRTHGEAAFQEGRHGHLAKLREPVATALEALLKPAPETPSREVQMALQQQFGSSAKMVHAELI
jgi:transposase